MAKKYKKEGWDSYYTNPILLSLAKREILADTVRVYHIHLFVASTELRWFCECTCGRNIAIKAMLTIPATVCCPERSLCLSLIVCPLDFFLLLSPCLKQFFFRKNSSCHGLHLLKILMHLYYTTFT